MTTGAFQGNIDAIDRGTSAFAFLWAIKRIDGKFEYFTSHDQDIVIGITIPVVDGGTKVIRFVATGSFAFSNARKEVGLRPENREANAVVNGFNFMASGGWNAFRERRYLGADIIQWRVDWRWPKWSALDQITYTITSVEYDRDTVTLEMQQKHLTRAREHFGVAFCRNCRFSLGDHDADGRGCGRDRTSQGGVHIQIENRTYTNRAIATVITQRRSFQISSLGLPIGHTFTQGAVKFQSSDNVDITLEVSFYDEATLTPFLSGTIHLVEDTPRDFAINDIVTVIEGCDGEFTTCKDTYKNELNFGGEKDMPGPRKARQPAREKV